MPANAWAAAQLAGDTEREIREIQYQRNGVYLIPAIILGKRPRQTPGKFGRMRKNYLRERHPILFNRLVLNGHLQSRLLEIEGISTSNELKRTKPFATLA